MDEKKLAAIRQEIARQDEALSSAYELLATHREILVDSADLEAIEQACTPPVRSAARAWVGVRC